MIDALDERAVRSPAQAETTDVDFLALDSGHLVVIDLPENRNRPHQNAFNGAFHVRSGAQIKPLTRDAMRALLTFIDTIKAWFRPAKYSKPIDNKFPSGANRIRSNALLS